MPSSVSRTCGPLNFIVVWLAKLTTRRPTTPELPLSTLDLRNQNLVETPTVPAVATETEQLVLSSRWQRGLSLPRPRYAEEPSSDRSNGRGYLDGAQNCQDTADSSKADEFASLFSVSPIIPSHSPVSSTGTPPLIQMSPPFAFLSPEVCTSLLDPDHGSSGVSTRASDEASIGELGKRRGFKGAPLFTSETARRPSTSFLSLSSAFSPKFSLSPRHSPPTPRTPLSAVTNRMRTPIARSPGKSPAKLLKPLVLQPEPPVSDEHQQSYDLGDPFSVTAVSFFGPETVGASVPLQNLERFDVYRTSSHRMLLVRDHRAVGVVSSVNIKIKETNICDMMVYNFQPKSKFGKTTKTRKSALPLRKLTDPDPTIIPPTFSSEEPQVRLPLHVWRGSEASPEDIVTYGHNVDPAHPVPPDFCSSFCPISLTDSHMVLVNIHPAIAPKAPCCPQNHISGPASRHFSDVSTDSATIFPRRQSLAIDDLLALLDSSDVETLNQVLSPVDSRTDFGEGEGVGCIIVA